MSTFILPCFRLPGLNLCIHYVFDMCQHKCFTKNFFVALEDEIKNLKFEIKKIMMRRQSKDNKVNCGAK